MDAHTQPLRSILRPDGSQWPQLLRHANASPRARQFRQELALPVDRPIVMSGHQADLWHPGILAKYFALQAIARKTGAEPIWLVVDHDIHAPGVTVPIRRASGRLDRAPAIQLTLKPNVPPARLPASSRVSVAALAPGETYATDGAADALARAASALNARASESTLARQIAFATVDLLKALGPTPRLLFATDIAQTSLMADLARDMSRSPTSMASHYNAAVAKRPKAHVAPLDMSSPDAPELPLWTLGSALGSERKKVFADTLPTLDRGQIMPRALLMTGMLRWLGCELFIHGMGGAGNDAESGYDAITQEWLHNWLGAKLAPMVLATASMYLDIPTPGGLITPEDIARARWQFHAAAHRPNMLNDPEGESARKQAVATLVSLRRKRDPQSRALKLGAYRDLHKTLELVRGRHANELQALKRAAEAAATRKHEADIIGDRTWSFVLYPEARLRALQAQIHAQVG